MTNVDDEITALLGDAGVLRYAAFTQGQTGGNPAGVVLDASGVDVASRLVIAAQVGYSETAFVEVGPREGEYRLRFFSPRGEVAFCGHATIAAAVALAERRGTGPLLFETLAGPVAVRTAQTAAGYSATLTSVPTRTRPVQSEELESALRALRWRRGDLDPRYPVHVAYAGNDHLVLAVRHRARLTDLDYDYDQLAAVMAARDWTTLHLVYAHSPLRFSARDPFPPGGVLEDPATGAAAAAFGGYLRALKLVDLPAEVTVLQGEDMGRPSRLLVRLAADDDRVQVTGTAAPLSACEAGNESDPTASSLPTTTLRGLHDARSAMPGGLRGARERLPAAFVPGHDALRIDEPRAISWGCPQ